MDASPTLVSFLLLALGFGLTAGGNGPEFQDQLASLIRERVASKVIKELKEVLKDPGTTKELLQVVDDMDLKVTKGGKDGKCILLSLSKDTCSVDLKVAKLSEVLPGLAARLAGAEDCLSLLEAAQPVVSNPCVCDEVRVAGGCPDVVRRIADAYRMFC